MSATGAGADAGGSQPTADPTETTTIRRRLRQKLSARTRAARGEARRQIEAQQPTGTSALGGGAGVVGSYTFLRSLSAFRSWLRRIFESTVIGTAALAQPGRSWLRSFIHSAYETGLRKARSTLRTQGYDIGDRSYEAAITDDRHQQTLARQYDRAAINLDDSVTNTAQEVSRAVADGGYLATADVNQRELTALINERIAANAGKRIDVLGDSIPVRSANRAAITEYASAGVEQAGVAPEADAEFRTSEDRYVCEECRGIAADNPYPLSEVPIPVVSTHPRCRCFILAL